MALYRPFIDLYRNALSVGFGHASPFFSGGTEHPCGGRMGRADIRVPAHSREVTPSGGKTVCADASPLPVRAGVSAGVGSRNEGSQAVCRPAEIGCLALKLRQGHL